MPNKNIFKLIRLFLLLYFLPIVLVAQDSLRVNLKAALDTVTTDTKKIDIWVELASSWSDNSIDSAIFYLTKAERLANEINYTQGIADVAKENGSVFSMSGKYSIALRELGKAQSIYRQLNDSSKLAKTYLLLGNIYSSTNSSAEALRYYKNAGLIFEELKDFKSLAAIHNNVGTIYFNADKIDSASIYFNKALLTYLELNDNISLSTIYTNIGIIYAEKDDLPKAIEYYEKSNSTLIKMNQTYGQSINNLNISDAYLHLKEYEKAGTYIKKAMEIAKSDKYKSILPDIYYTVGEIEEAKHNFKEALVWYKKSENLTDSLFNTDTNTAKMEVQTQQLEEIQQLEIERIRQINEGTLKAEKLKNTLLLVISGFVLVLLLVATTYFYRRARIAKQINSQNLQILNQKSKIYQQAKSIADKNESLLEKNKKLEELNEEKNYLMNVVAHDLKSPLNQIQGLAEVIRLEEETLSDTQKECLATMSTSSERLSRMINRILSTRAIDSEISEFEPQKVKITPILNLIVENFKPLADKKNISIKIVNQKELPVVMGDKHHIQQVIENVISNAIKFSPSLKTITVDFTLEDKRVVYSIKDEGPGLTKEDHKNLFVEYASLSAQPTGDESSTGLGLSIVKKYIELMEGEIWCESTAGNGATFYLAFNLA